MNPEEQFKNIIQKGKQSVFLSAEEKSAMKKELVKFMQANPLADEVALPQKASFAWFSVIRPQYAMLGLLVVVIGGAAGISLAAQGALPGQSLYSVKTNVNQKVADFFTPNVEAKAKLHIAFANTTLAEIQQAEKAGKLDAQAKTEAEVAFDENVRQAKLNINHVNDIAVISRLQGLLDTTVNTHVRVLSDLAGIALNANAAASGQISPSGTKPMAITLKSPLADFHTQSQLETKLSGLQNALQKVSRQVAKTQSQFSADAYASMQQNIAIANSTLLEAKAKLDAGDYAAATALMQSLAVTNDSIAQQINATVSVHGSAKVQASPVPAVAPALPVANLGNQETQLQNLQLEIDNQVKTLEGALK